MFQNLFPSCSPISIILISFEDSKSLIEYAAKLLVEQPDKSIVNIAKECGFSSHTYFSDCFHRHFDMSPSDFRHEALTQDKKNLAV